MSRVNPPSPCQPSADRLLCYPRPASAWPEHGGGCRESAAERQKEVEDRGGDEGGFAKEAISDSYINVTEGKAIGIITIEDVLEARLLLACGSRSWRHDAAALGDTRTCDTAYPHA